MASFISLALSISRPSFIIKLLIAIAAFLFLQSDNISISSILTLPDYAI